MMKSEPNDQRVPVPQEKASIEKLAADSTTEISAAKSLAATSELQADGVTQDWSFAATSDFSADPPASGREVGIDRSVSIPGYKIKGILGRGGMGLVYKALQVKADRLVALKVILQSDQKNTASLERFAIEARASAQLQHPNIIQLYDVGEHLGLSYFTLEYAPGGTLANRISQQLLSNEATAKTVLILCRAVAYAHSKGIIHRDLKPTNILLTADDTLKVADFGLARRQEERSQLTQDGTIIGTPSYMAPEQASGTVHEITYSCDLYAIGAILYELLTGRPPFKGSTVWEVLHLVRTAEPTPPSELRPGIPKDLETICLKCLQKEPGKRYGSANELADDLQRHLNNEPILARPIGRVERLARLAKRHPAEAKLFGLFATILLLSLVGALWAVWQIVGQRDQIASEKQISDDRLGLYRNSVSSFVNRVPQLLEGVPLSEGTRHELSAMTAEVLDKSGDASTSGTDLQRARAQIALLIRRGNLHLEPINEQQRQTEAAALAIELALREFQEAERLAYQQLRLEHGDRAKDLANLALVTSRRATALALGSTTPEQADKAIEVMHAAIDFRQQAAKLPSGEEPTALRSAELGREIANLASIQLQFSDYFERLDDARASLKSGQDAIEMIQQGLEQLPPEHRSRANCERDLAIAAEVTSVAAERLGKTDEAAESLIKAIESCQRLVKGEPQRLGHKLNLVRFASRLGDLYLMNKKDPDAARAEYVKAMLQLRQMYYDPQLQLLLEQGLAMGYYRLGLAAIAQGDQEKSHDYFLRCSLIREVDLKQKMDNKNVAKNPVLVCDERIGLMLANARTGAAERQRFALTEARSLASLAGVTEDQVQKIKLFRFAAQGLGILAQQVSSDKQTLLLDEGFQLLHSAVNLGYKDAGYLANDPDMQPLQAHPKFMGLLKSLEQKSE